VEQYLPLAVGSNLCHVKECFTKNYRRWLYSGRFLLFSGVNCFQTNKLIKVFDLQVWRTVLEITKGLDTYVEQVWDSIVRSYVYKTKTLSDVEWSATTIITTLECTYNKTRLLDYWMIQVSSDVQGFWLCSEASNTNWLLVQNKYYRLLLMLWILYKNIGFNPKAKTDNYW
jgi:hypothetical protein